MAPVNFEKNIREKMQERELQPSKDAWDNLSAQLGEPEEKKSGGFFWLAFAASLVGVLVISGYFLTKNQSGLENDLVDDTKKELINTTPIPNIDNELEIIDEGSMLTIEKSQEDGEVLTGDKSTKVLTQRTVAKMDDISAEVMPNESLKRDLHIGDNTQEVIAEVVGFKEDKKERIQEIKSHIPFEKDELFINTKINEVVASVHDIQSKNKEVSMQEIDELLAQAQKDIAMERILSSTKVDAEALLMDVELDLERTFRDRVFYALGEGFDYVKTTVVNGHD